jgi:hypothetical protein
MDGFSGTPLSQIINENNNFDDVFNPNNQNGMQGNGFMMNQPTVIRRSGQQLDPRDVPPIIQQNKIHNLVNDINNSLPPDLYSEEPPQAMRMNRPRRKSKRERKEKLQKLKQKIIDIKEKEKEQSFFESIPYSVKEFTILLLIYLLLSVGVVKKTIGEYIRQISPKEDGSISFIGIIIYGCLLAGLFLLAKYLIL